jgi:hypothetical protein
MPAGMVSLFPFFGVERKGSPVFGFLRLGEQPIRRNTQVYEPEILLIFDDRWWIYRQHTTSETRRANHSKFKKPASELIKIPLSGRQGSKSRRYRHIS